MVDGKWIVYETTYEPYHKNGLPCHSPNWGSCCVEFFYVPNNKKLEKGEVEIIPQRYFHDFAIKKCEKSFSETKRKLRLFLNDIGYREIGVEMTRIIYLRRIKR